jgi:cephalosporin-C deacetylase-like acetyl esterase
MKTMKKLIVFLILGMVIQSNAQNLLQGKWKFITGDKPAYSQPSFDDRNWDMIDAGDVWENQGYEGYNGFGWYRFKTIIPSAMKANAIKYGGLVLDLQKIDDSDETFLNGEIIGKQGDMPPNYVGAYDAERKYTIPFDKIRWDEENTIAVRVYDQSGGGGIYGGATSLQIKGLTDNLKINVNYLQPDHVVRSGSSIELPLLLTNNNNEPLSGALVINVENDFGEKAFSLEKPIVLKKKSQKSDKVLISPLMPGFYKATVQLNTDLATIQSTTAFAIEPEKIVSPADPRPDFDSYWARAKKELAAVDPQYKLIKIDSLSTPTRNAYLLEMRSLGNVLIRGWYAEPVKPGKYPAILHVQGYSSNMILDWAYPGDDFVVLALNVRGHGNSRDNIAPSFNSVPSYLQTQLADKEQYIYRGAYMDTRRAVDFLFSRSLVDTSKVVVEGGSQGGALSFATAALNNDRIRLCVPAVPFLSDFPHYFIVGNWPGNEFKEYKMAHPELSWETIYETLSYIDIKNLAGWIKAPVFMGVGLRDDVCPNHINFAAYNQLKGYKEYVVFPDAGHGLPGAWDGMKYNWIKKQLGM